MMKIFSKQKMLDRLKEEGREHLINDEAMKIMDMLDGKEAHKNRFKSLVYGELEYFVKVGEDIYPVNPNDCIIK